MSKQKNDMPFLFFCKKTTKNSKPKATQETPLFHTYFQSVLPLLSHHKH